MTSIEVLSLILSIVGLSASIIFGTFIFTLHSKQAQLENTLHKTEKMIADANRIFIASLSRDISMFSTDNRAGLCIFHIKGSKFIDWIQKSYQLTDITNTLLFCQNADQDKLYEAYIQDNQHLFKEVEKDNNLHYYD